MRVKELKEGYYLINYINCKQNITSYLLAKYDRLITMTSKINLL